MKKSRAITETDIYFKLSRTRTETLRKETIKNTRANFKTLWLLGRITNKERDYLSYELDKILYLKENMKGGLKE